MRLIVTVSGVTCSPCSPLPLSPCSLIFIHWNNCQSELSDKISLPFRPPWSGSTATAQWNSGTKYDVSFSPVASSQGRKAYIVGWWLMVFSPLCYTPSPLGNIEISSGASFVFLSSLLQNKNQLEYFPFLPLPSSLHRPPCVKSKVTKFIKE